MSTKTAEALKGAPATPSHVPNMKYAYEVGVGGVVDLKMTVDDINEISVHDDDYVMGNTAFCPVHSGACVSSVTGGVVRGFDMLGQFCEQTVGAAGTSTIAFAGITSAPADALWANRYGLPYKYSGVAANAPAGITFIASAADGDARGTFTVNAGVTAETEVRLMYLADDTNLHGDPYSARFTTPDRVADDPTTGTLNSATGAIAITTAVAADTSSYQFFTMPDGAVVRAANGIGTVNYTLPKLWLSKYGSTLGATLVITGVTEAGTNIPVTLTVS